MQLLFFRQPIINLIFFSYKKSQQLTREIYAYQPWRFCVQSFHYILLLLCSLMANLFVFDLCAQFSWHSYALYDADKRLNAESQQRFVSFFCRFFQNIFHCSLLRMLLILVVAFFLFVRLLYFFSVGCWVGGGTCSNFSHFKCGNENKCDLWHTQSLGCRANGNSQKVGRGIQKKLNEKINVFLVVQKLCADILEKTCVC